MTLTYNSLISSLQDLLVATVAADTVIWQGESQLLRDLDLDLFSANASGTTSGASIAKPDGFLYLRSPILLTYSGQKQIPEERSYSFLKRYWPDAAATGIPRYFAHASETGFIIAPTANGWSYSYDYGFRPAGLAPGTQETWLSKTVPDALFAACIVSSLRYLKTDERVDQLKADYQSLLAGAKMQISSMTHARTSPASAAAEAPAPKD